MVNNYRILENYKFNLDGFIEKNCNFADLKAYILCS